MKLMSAVLFAVLLPSVAAAQSGVFIQGGPLVDALFTSGADDDSVSWAASSISIIGGITSAGVASTFLPPDRGQSSKKRFSPGASAAVGVFLSPSVSLRLEGSFQGEHVTSAGWSGDRQTAKATDIMVAAGWHQGHARKVSIAYLAGMVFRRQRDEFTFPVSRAMTTPGIGLPPASSSFMPIELDFDSTSYSAGVMTGLDVVFKLSPRVAIVPQVRMIAANHAWNLRPAVTMRWRP